MKKVKHFFKSLGKAYLDSMIELYRPALDAGIPVIFH